jgi:hypothetical protein
MTEMLSYLCPFCGRQARVGRPCPGCEKKPRKKKRSWESDPASDGLDLPDGDFDYDDFVAREFGKSPHRKLGVKWYWWLLAVIVLTAMLAGTLLMR